MRPLVGRQRELAGLERVVSRAESGESRILVVSGEQGIGKTRLFEELGRLAADQDYLVLSSRASELESDLPYWVFVDALEEHLASLTEVDWIDEELRLDLGRILPRFFDDVSPFGTVLDERYRAHRAVRHVLERLAETRPLAVLLDDLHWADQSSVELLSALLRRPPQGQVLIALAFRPRQSPHRLTVSLELAERTGSVDVLKLDALSESEAGQFLMDLVDPHIASALYRDYGGNPFYLEQAARIAEQLPHAPASTSLGQGDVPAAVEAAITQELDRLPEVALRFLQGAAVAGDPFDPELAGITAGMRTRQALEALDALITVDLVRPTEMPRRFCFRHPLVRQAVYGSTPRGWRLAAHERAARALAAQGEARTTWAHHLEQYARRGDVEAISTLRAAANSSAESAPASAARWYRAALSLLPEDEGTHQERVELLVPLARVLGGTGDLEGSRTALVQALAIVPAEPSSQPTHLTAALARVEHLLGRHDDAHERLVATFNSLPSSTSREATAVMLDLVNDAFYRADYQKMRDWALRALATATSLDESAFVAAAHAAVGAADAFVGRIREAESHRTKSSEIIELLSDDEVSARLDSLSHLVVADIYLDRYRDATIHAERGLAVGRASAQGQLFPQFTFCLHAIANSGAGVERRE